MIRVMTLFFIILVMLPPVNLMADDEFDEMTFEELVELIYNSDFHSEGRREYATLNGSFLCYEHDDYIEISNFGLYSIFPETIIENIYYHIFDYLEIPDFINNKPVKAIGRHAFSDIKIRTIKLPLYLEIINEYAFSASNIEEIIFNDYLRVIGEYAFVGSRMKNLTIPDTVIDIGRNAFWLSRIENLIIGNGIKVLRQDVFNAGSLITVTLPESLELIEEAAFWYTGLERITIPENVYRIGVNAFSDNPLTEIIIGNNVEFELPFAYNEFNRFINFYNNNNKRSGKYLLFRNNITREYFWEYNE